MTQNGESLGDAERHAVYSLEPELREHGKMTQFAFDLIGTTLAKTPVILLRDVPQSRKVATSLLVRLSNDLRATALLALRGYPIQAASIVASMYEVAFAVAVIGADKQKAQQWIDHAEPTRSFQNVKSMTSEGLKKLGVPDADNHANKRYEVYSQLCMARHANPLLQKQFGIQVHYDDVVAMNGPDTSEGAVRMAWFALDHAAFLSYVALASFITNHSPMVEQDNLRKQSEALGAWRHRLEQAAVQRWGTEDPYPGKWRIK